MITNLPTDQQQLIVIFQNSRGQSRSMKFTVVIRSQFAAFAYFGHVLRSEAIVPVKLYWPDRAIGTDDMRILSVTQSPLSPCFAIAYYNGSLFRVPENCSLAYSVTVRDDHERAIVTIPCCRPLLIPANSKTEIDQRDSGSSWLMHNHPSGDPTPSQADIAMTREIAAVAKPLGIAVHDHIIVGKDGHASLKWLKLI